MMEIGMTIGGSMELLVLGINIFLVGMSIALMVLGIKALSIYIRKNS